MNKFESHEKSVCGMFSRVTHSKFQFAMTAFSPRNFTVKVNVTAPETVSHLIFQKCTKAKTWTEITIKYSNYVFTDD